MDLSRAVYSRDLKIDDGRLPFAIG